MGASRSPRSQVAAAGSDVRTTLAEAAGGAGCGGGSGGGGGSPHASLCIAASLATDGGTALLDDFLADRVAVAEVAGGGIALASSRMLTLADDIAPRPGAHPNSEGKRNESLIHFKAL